MDFFESFLTPQQLVRESEVLSEFCRLIVEERSRYENQAEIFLETGSFSRVNGDYSFKYKMKDDCFVWHAKPFSPTENSYSSEVPIPEAMVDKIETLIEFFAQSEAGFIS
jgi:hypothetical protein